MDKVSIIVPVYNGSNYLEKCLNSLINQTYKNIEIIVINDGSIDNSLEIIKRYQKNDQRIILIDKKNTGVSDSRNKGIEKATGDYICFLDADDFYENNYVEVMLNIIKKENVDVIRCNYKVVDEKNELIENGKIDSYQGKRYDQKMIRDIIIPKCLSGSIPCFCVLLMIKKKSLKEEFPLDINMMEDVIFYLKLLKDIDSMYIIDDKLYNVFYNTCGATNNICNYERNIFNVLKVNSYLKDELKKINLLNDEINNIINVTTLNAVSDFIFRDYLYSKNDTIKLCMKINSLEFVNLISDTDLKLINFQRRTIIKLIKNKAYIKLRIYMFLRKVIFNLRRRWK